MRGLLIVLRVASLCMYLFVRMALRSSLRWARATYSGLVAIILPFISVTAFVASSGEEKHTKPKPLLWPLSVITWGDKQEQSFYAAKYTRVTKTANPSCLLNIWHAIFSFQILTILYTQYIVLYTKQNVYKLHLCTCDCAIRWKLFTEPLIIYGIVQVLHIQIHALKQRQE